MRGWKSDLVGICISTPNIRLGYNVRFKRTEQSNVGFVSKRTEHFVWSVRFQNEPNIYLFVRIVSKRTEHFFDRFKTNRIFVCSVQNEQSNVRFVWNEHYSPTECSDPGLKKKLFENHFWDTFFFLCIIILHSLEKQFSNQRMETYFGTHFWHKMPPPEVLVFFVQSIIFSFQS